MKFAVLGAGHGGQTMAADLTLAGYEVHLFEMERFKANIKPIIERGGIEYTGIPSVAGRTGFAEIDFVTSNMKEAVEGVEVIHINIPAQGHETQMRLLAPHLVDGQMIVVWPDNWGAIRLRKYMEETGNDAKIMAAGGVSNLYACRRVTPVRVWVRRIKVNLRVAAYPRSDTDQVIKTLTRPWPNRLIRGENILEVTLSNDNWFYHPPLMIFNACRIESDKGDFNLWKAGGYEPSYGVKSPSKLWLKLMKERNQIMQRFGFKTEYPIDYPPGHPVAILTESDLKEYNKMIIPGVVQSNPDNAPNSLNFRYLTEDVPYGLVPLHHLGCIVDTPTPFTDSTIHIGGLLLERDFWEEGINLEKLGWSGLSAKEILERL
jgi:opine dehydrogenase